MSRHRVLHIPEYVVKCTVGHYYDREQYGDRCPICWAIDVLTRHDDAGMTQQQMKAILGAVDDVRAALDRLEKIITRGSGGGIHDASEDTP